MATLRCSDCGKPDVHLTDFFLVPDKVWDALCPLDAIVCLGCFGKRLNPAVLADKESLEEEIYRQRKRFKLKNVNRWLGDKSSGVLYRGRYLILVHLEPKVAAGLDEEMLKKRMTSKRVHERNAAAINPDTNWGRYSNSHWVMPINSRPPGTASPVVAALRR